MKLYASDGVFMAQTFPSSVGADAVREAYDGVFRAITLTVRFAVAEVKQVGSDWALRARIRPGWSRLTQLARAAQRPTRNSLSFKGRHDWKIARYCFASHVPTRRVHKVKMGLAMAMMKAAVIRTAGGPEVLKDPRASSIPQPRNDQVLISIKASGLNRSELFTRQGH